MLKTSQRPNQYASKNRPLFWHPACVDGLNKFAVEIRKDFSKSPNFCFRLIKHNLHLSFALPSLGFGPRFAGFLGVKSFELSEISLFEAKVNLEEISQLFFFLFTSHTTAIDRKNVIPEGEKSYVCLEVSEHFRLAEYAELLL